MKKTMKKTIKFSGKDFARAIAAGRKFLNKAKATSFAIEIRDQFLVEVIENKEENRTRAYLWASDNYRAARVEIPVFDAEGGSFVAAIHNPVFTPAAGTHVTIELGTMNKERVATLTYHEYGATFSTKQPKRGEVSAKDQLKVLKDYLEQSIKANPKAKQNVNSRYLKEALEAVLICNGNVKIPVSLAMCGVLSPILLRGADIDAIVLPTRTPVGNGKDD